MRSGAPIGSRELIATPQPILIFCIPPYQHEALRILKRQRLQQNTIDHAEHGSVCTNAEREREHGNRRKHRIFNQYSRAVTDVSE